MYFTHFCLSPLFAFRGAHNLNSFLNACILFKTKYMCVCYIPPLSHQHTIIFLYVCRFIRIFHLEFKQRRQLICHKYTILRDFSWPLPYKNPIGETTHNLSQSCVPYVANSYRIVKSHAHTNKINNDRDVIIQSTQTTHTIQILCCGHGHRTTAALTVLSGYVWSEC